MTKKLFHWIVEKGACACGSARGSGSSAIESTTCPDCLVVYAERGPLPEKPMDFGPARAAAVDLVRDHAGVDHIWLNAFKCIHPSDQFAAEVGREIIAKVMAQQSDDVMKRRHIVLRINAS